MKPQRVVAIAKKEWIHIFRDPRSAAMAIAIPVLLLLLFGYALRLDVDQVPLVIWDRDKTPISYAYISNFQASRYFTIAGYVERYKDLESFFDKNKALMALVIPSQFSKRLQSNQEVFVQLLVDGSDANTAMMAIGYARSVTAMSNKAFLLRELSQKGLSYHPVIEMRLRVWFNPDLESKHYIIPGLIAVIMMVIAALLTSLTIAKEWETGTMELLISTPIDPNELIMGKLIPYFVIGFVDILIAVAMGQFLFHVPLKGHILLLFLLSGFFLMGALSLGMAISIVAKNQLLASQLAMVTTFLPTFLLSGFMYSISNMPQVIQILTHLIPARYFVTILKGIYMKGVGLEVLGLQAFSLFLFSFITLAWANKKFQKKIL